MVKEIHIISCGLPGGPVTRYDIVVCNIAEGRLIDKQYFMSIYELEKAKAVALLMCKTYPRTFRDIYIDSTLFLRIPFSNSQ